MILLGNLSSRERALVAVSVLLDGTAASEYLSSDKERQEELVRVAQEFAKLAPEFQVALAGSLLRRSIEELQKS